MKSDEELLGAMFDARLKKIEQLEDEIVRLKAELEQPRGDGYNCSNGCAHCCSMHACDCYN